eukprot:355027-Chlamydomonas_euryale.AAC.6
MQRKEEGGRGVVLTNAAASACVGLYATTCPTGRPEKPPGAAWSARSPMRSATACRAGSSCVRCGFGGVGGWKRARPACGVDLAAWKDGRGLVPRAVRVEG